MNIQKFTKLVPVLGIACMVSLPAMAQTTTSGTMTPAATSQSSTTTATTKKHDKHGKHDKMDKKSDAKDHKTKDADKTRAKDHSSKLPADEQFSSLSAATAHCPSGTVEWATLGGSKVYHSSKSRYFGKTKSGAYACKAALDSAGFRPAKD